MNKLWSLFFLFLGFSLLLLLSFGCFNRIFRPGLDLEVLMRNTYKLTVFTSDWLLIIVCDIKFDTFKFPYVKQIVVSSTLASKLTFLRLWADLAMLIFTWFIKFFFNSFLKLVHDRFDHIIIYSPICLHFIHSVIEGFTKWSKLINSLGRCAYLRLALVLILQGFPALI